MIDALLTVNLIEIYKRGKIKFMMKEYEQS